MNVKGNLKFTMRLRLFLFLIVLVVTMLLGLLILLLVTGNITAGLMESEIFIKNEHSNILEDVSRYYENLAAETVGFSRNVSLSIERKLKEKSLNVSVLNSHPELLEGLISDELYQVLLYLQKSKSSGAFIILDATINNRLPNAKISKAGIYLKNMEPNIVNSTSPTVYVLRGFPDTAYNNSLPLHSQWKMEFDVSDAPYYNLPMKNAAEKNLPLSKLYYWSNAFEFPDTNEEVMVCSIPLIDSNGNVFGVCGFDVSSMLFKLSNLPDNSMYKRIFCMISPVEDNVIKTNQSLFSSGFSAKNVINNKDLTISPGKKSLYTYSNVATNFIGYHEYIQLHSEESAFSNNKWILSIMVPEEDVKNYIVKSNLKLLLICTLFMILGVITSVVISKYYIAPISKGFDIIRNNTGSNSKTNIQEVDDLIKFLLAKEEKNYIEKEKDPNSIILNEFLKNVKSLSPAECSVFNLYAQQYTAKEIAQNLCLSINTIKTHTKHIYSKLNITSKEELFLYVEMLKESGKIIK